MNKMKPIWMRSPREVKDEEYAEFYKSTFKAWDEVAAHTHFSLEGQVEFRALLFVPSVLPYELSRNMFDESSRNMRLYVKRVFINDKFEELLPRWLMFLRGVVSPERQQESVVPNGGSAALNRFVLLVPRLNHITRGARRFSCRGYFCPSPIPPGGS